MEVEKGGKRKTEALIPGTDFNYYLAAMPLPLLTSVFVIKFGILLFCIYLF
jgi:hypothetical protein